MIRKILCAKCAEGYTLHPLDEREGMKLRKVPIAALRMPPGHGTTINGVFFATETLLCDLCGEELKQNGPAEAVTMWDTNREGTPGHWEQEYEGRQQAPQPSNLNLSAALKMIRVHGPSRVLCEDGSAVRVDDPAAPPISIIFIRHDGWSLGAPAGLVGEAFKLWAKEWVAWVKCSDLLNHEPMATFNLEDWK